MATQHEGTGPDDLAARLRLVVARLHRRIRLQSAEGLTPSQLSTVATLAARGPLRMGELAGREGIGAPAATRIVASLEELGLAERRPDPADRRSSLVQLSAAGAERLAELRRRGTARLADRLAALEPAELADVAAALEVLDRLAGVDETARADPD